MRYNYRRSVIAVCGNTLYRTFEYAHYVSTCRRHKVYAFMSCPVAVSGIVDKFAVGICLTERIFLYRVSHDKFFGFFDIRIRIVVIVVIVVFVIVHIVIVVIDIAGYITRLCGLECFLAVIVYDYSNGDHRCNCKNTYNHKDNVYVLFEKLCYSLSCLRRSVASFVFGFVFFVCHFYLR